VYPHHHHRQNGQGGLGIGHVAQEVGEGEGVEGPVGERELLGPAGHEPDPVGETAPLHVRPSLEEHLRGQVDADHLGGRPVGELEGDTGRPGGHVQHPVRPLGDDVPHHRPPPPAVLAEGQQGGEPVVALRKRGEQALGEPVGVVRVRLLHGPSSGARISP
jgi:hypothetical protein